MYQTLLSYNQAEYMNSILSISKKAQSYIKTRYGVILQNSLKGCIEIHSYRQVSDISRTLVGNKIVDHSDVVGASPVGAAPPTSSFSTWRLASMDWAKTTARGYKKNVGFGIWRDLY